MKSIILIHNGDYKNRCPYWFVRLFASGKAWVEVIGPRSDYTKMEGFEKILPADLLSQVFELPSSLIGRDLAVHAPP